MNILTLFFLLQFFFCLKKIKKTETIKFLITNIYIWRERTRKKNELDKGLYLHNLEMNIKKKREYKRQGVYKMCRDKNKNEEQRNDKDEITMTE